MNTMNTTVARDLGSVEGSFSGDELLIAFALNTLGKWVDMAATAVFVYEWLITMDMEVQLIWCDKDTSQKKQRLTKVLYFVNRYGIVLDLILNGLASYGFNVGSCRVLLQVLGAMIVLGIYVSEFILVLRVCAVWNKNKIIIFLLGTSYIGALVYVLTSFYLMLRPAKFFTLLPWGGCYPDTEGSTLWISYTVLLIYDIVMVSLMAYPAIKQYKLFHGRTELMRRVYDEGIIFYMFLVLVDIVNVALQQLMPEDVFFFPIPARILRSILASRTVLHIREYSSQQVRAYAPNAISTIEFDRSRGAMGREAEEY